MELIFWLKCFWQTKAQVANGCTRLWEPTWNVDIPPAVRLMNIEWSLCKRDVIYIRKSYYYCQWFWKVVPYISSTHYAVLSYPTHNGCHRQWDHLGPFSSSPASVSARLLIFLLLLNVAATWDRYMLFHCCIFFPVHYCADRLCGHYSFILLDLQSHRTQAMLVSHTTPL